jgi:hypothetical protein
MPPGDIGWSLVRPLGQTGEMSDDPTPTVSEIFDPEAWKEVPGFGFTDITYHRAVDAGVVRVAFNRPEIRNAFRPHTVDELFRALDHARMSTDVGCVLLPPLAMVGGRSVQAVTSGSAERTVTNTPKARPPTPSNRAVPGGSTSSKCSDSSASCPRS